MREKRPPTRASVKYQLVVACGLGLVELVLTIVNVVEQDWMPAAIFGMFTVLFAGVALVSLRQWRTLDSSP
jgi:protein-S-isoprenylcysteine O-methyltransferase Ste14